MTNVGATTQEPTPEGHWTIGTFDLVVFERWRAALQGASCDFKVVSPE